MFIIKHKTLFCVGLMILLFVLSISVKAQEISLRYNYRLDLSDATEAPQFNGSPDINYPETARKNGVEGTLKLTLTLGEDGKVKDISTQQDLPFGVTEAVTKGLQQWHFQPAKRINKPIAVKMFFDYIVSVAYSENDKNVSKPKITEKPAAIYPSSQKAEGRKDKVQVHVMFYNDGTLKVVGVSSVMPREFDKAAMEAAQKIKFEPAVHKKSKKAVTQQMTVEYNFKP